MTNFFQQAPPAQPQFAPPAPQQYAAPQQGGFFQTQDPHQQAQMPPAPQQPVPAPADTSSFFGGAAVISFDDRKGYVKGTPRGGQIIDKKISNQTKLGTGEVLTWSDGSPRKQMVLTLQTAERTDPQDNGQRQLFVKGDMPRAVREAFQSAGAKDVELGGWIYVAWVSENAAKQAGYNPQKVYKAIYAPPGAPDPMAGQPTYQPVPNAPVPVPEPAATPDHYAAYAAQQAAGGPPPMPQMPAVAPQYAPPAPAAAPQQFAPQGTAQPQQGPPVLPAGANPFGGAPAQPAGPAPNPFG